MIAGIFHKGSGLGNQLARYVMTRCLALDKGYEWGMQNPQNFKGTFMTLDMGIPIQGITNYYTEQKVDHHGTDVRGVDGYMKHIRDNTIIDGEFQAEAYWGHRKDEIRKWLRVDPVFLRKNLCIINFRGGEYTIFPDLFLTQKYWNDAIKNMLEENRNMIFMVMTDDVASARVFFPDYDIYHNFENDYRYIQFAHYLILSNSSFAIFPALLNQNVKKIIAPKYWARHNVSNGYWALQQNIYKGWSYQDREGNLEVHT